MTRIVTVTLGPALDISLVVDRLAPERKLRIDAPELAPGGGGINVARAIRRLGGSALALWMRGGPTGQRIASLLDAEGVEYEAFPIADETRSNIHIQERATGRAYRLETPAAHVAAAEAAALLARVVSIGADYLVLSGSLPPGLPTDYFARLARSVGQQTRVVLDTSGAALRDAVPAGIYLVKPNALELAELAGRPLEREVDRIEAARTLVRERGVGVVATELGTDEGLIVVSADGVDRVPVTGISTVSPIGAGDSTVAGIVHGLARGLDLADAARLGAAAGAAAALTPGTELCLRRDTERIWAYLQRGRASVAVLTATREQPADLEHARVEDVLAQLGSDPERGLGVDEARKRLETSGPNEIAEEKQSLWRHLLSYFWGPIPWMLEAACVLSAIGQRWEELLVILAMLLINGGVGWWHESSAARAIAALKEQLARKARVIRGGERHTIDARELVPGDVIVVRRGDVIPADAKLLRDELSLDESALTGESLPVDKTAGDIVYASTAAKRGSARALVIGTGRATRFGRTVELVAGVHDRSHFQKAVIRIGDFLMVATAALVVAVVVVGVVRAESVTSLLLFALILVVAGIPVALPAVLSVTMAVGARRLAASKAIVSRLAAMEELAGVKVLFSDKTGTLTENRIALQEPVLLAATDRDELVLAAALTADRGEERDPIDSAVLAAVAPGRLARFTVQDFQPFDSTRKRAEARVTEGERSFRVAKGAPQVVLELCKADAALRERVDRAVDKLGAGGFRALGVARSDDEQWQYLGLLSLLDPPRPDSAQVIEQARAYGIDVRMVTGDHEAIARQVAGQVGLGQKIAAAGDWLRRDDPQTTERVLAAEGFAEVTPEDKFHLVERFQRQGLIVGMTGDGVNDAPALEKADVGFAVSGATDAARAAADIVLTEPGLGVIIRAIEEARRIFERMLSYATFRIAETMRMVAFIGGTIIAFGIYPVSAIMVALLAILNDIPIMTIATDNTRTSREPVRWNMRWVLADASLLGLSGVVASFLLLWFVRTQLHVATAQLQTLIFLKLLVAGHMTIYVTRVRDWFWKRPWPSWKLLVALELTQVLGTLVAVYGWLVPPIGWGYALGIWAYAIVWMFLLSAVRVVAFRKLRPRLRRPRGGARRADEQRPRVALTA